jgi:hypothetical protein
VGADGTFCIEHLLPGAYTLSLWADGEKRIVQTKDVRVGATGAENVTLTW